MVAPSAVAQNEGFTFWVIQNLRDADINVRGARCSSRIFNNVRINKIRTTRSARAAARCGCEVMRAATQTITGRIVVGATARGIAVVAVEIKNIIRITTSA